MQAKLVDVSSKNDTDVIEVQHIDKGIKLHPRETGIQVVLEVKSPEHAHTVLEACKASFTIEIVS